MRIVNEVGEQLKKLTILNIINTAMIQYIIFNRF